MTATRSLTVERGDVRLHVEVHGSVTGAAPLVLTHGFGSSSAMWRPNLDALTRDRRVVTWDLRGHGRTVTPLDPSYFTRNATLDDLAAVLDACGVEVAVLGGLSVGGYLSLAYYLAHPERVTALVACDTGPGFKRDDARARWNDHAVEMAEGYEREGIDALRDSPEVRLAEHDPAGLALAARGILPQADATVINGLPSIGVPTLLVVGADDEPFLGAADYMAVKIPDATKVVIPGAGHASNVDQPEAFDEAVTAFLDRIGTGTTRG